MKMHLDKTLIIYALTFFLSIFFGVYAQNIAINLIFNPDVENYFLLYSACSITDGCAVEPFFWVVSEVGHQLNVDYSILYFAYPFMTFLVISATAISWQGVGFKSRLMFVITWLAAFGTLHALVQIRFGLACALAVFATTAGYSLRFKASAFVWATLSHFAVLLAFLTLIPGTVTDRRLSLLTNLASLVTMFLIKTGSLFGFLPTFIFARISSYSEIYVESISLANQAISLALYLYLTLCVLTRRLPPMFAVAAVGFLPYFIIPESEIIVRLGIPFQFVLLAGLCSNFKIGSGFLYPVVAFFAYKTYSNVNYMLFLWGG
jgi:hypothetical protein